MSNLETLISVVGGYIKDFEKAENMDLNTLNKRYSQILKFKRWESGK